MNSDQRKLQQLINKLKQELRNSNIQTNFKISDQQDPSIELERVFKEMIFHIEQQQSAIKEDFQSQLKKNQGIILECLQYFLSVNQQLFMFSKLLYSQDYSLEAYKSFRKLYQIINSTSNTLYQYESQDDNFLNSKQDLIAQNLSICQQIFRNSAENKNTENIQEFGKTQQVMELREQIEALNQLLKHNDQQFAQEIQKYNNTLYDLQETIREYEIRMDKVRDYENIIEDLEHKLVRLKEEKYRDDMLIDNMSKKIRIYEKQRGGMDSFVSPRANRRTLVSPSNRFAANNSSMSMNPYDMRYQSFMSNRVATEQETR